MSSREARCQQNSDALIYLGVHSFDYSERHCNRNDKLQKENDKPVHVEAKHPFYLFTCPLRLPHLKSIDSDNGKNQNDQHPRVGSNRGRKRQDSQSLFSHGQSDKAGDHTGRNKEFLKTRNFCTHQLPGQNQD